MELKYLINDTSKEYPFYIDAANEHLKDADFKVVVTNFINGAPAYLSVKKYGWFKTMEATGSLPMATRGYCEIAGGKYIDGGLSDPLPVKRVYDWGFRSIILLRTHPNDLKPDWNLESLYAPLFYRNNSKLKKLILRNDKIYARGQQYLSQLPNDLELIQVVPEKDLECGVISSNMEQVRRDYRYGLELGLDALPKLRTLAINFAD